eukprot:m.1397327 g.1397327  ORF g.1397327 m.1397327 type:complete len:92 (-) comp24997_c1_seq2:913-1188(-)
MSLHQFANLGTCALSPEGADIAGDTGKCSMPAVFSNPRVSSMSPWTSDSVSYGRSWGELSLIYQCKHIVIIYFRRMCNDEIFRKHFEETAS